MAYGRVVGQLASVGCFYSFGRAQKLLLFYFKQEK